MRENDNEGFAERAEMMPMPAIEIRAERWPIVDILAQDDPRTKAFDHLDRETRLRIAPLIEHPEAREQVLAALRKDKIEVNDEDVDAYCGVLNEIAEDQHDHIAELLADQEEDVKKREAKRGEYEKRIGALVAFFRPKAQTTPERTVLILPTNPSLGEKEGYAVPIGETLAIESHVENPENVDHEFLHAVINPITEKLPLTEEDERKIVASSSRGLILDQEYGESPLSLLNETLIRTYVHRYTKGERPISAESIRARISSFDENTYSAALEQNDGRLKKELNSLSITSLADFQSRWQEYYDRYVRDELAEKVYSLYETYDEERQRDPAITFEDYVLSHAANLSL